MSSLATTVLASTSQSSIVEVAVCVDYYPLLKKKIRGIQLLISENSVSALPIPPDSEGDLSLYEETFDAWQNAQDELRIGNTEVLFERGNGYLMHDVPENERVVDFSGVRAVRAFGQCDTRAAEYRHLPAAVNLTNIRA
ncbi:hypothetical protein BDY19DRAFT_905735 [Irpex rosettiformis]|uniref:Uncharacterized protein n=1 Tax=Irpex rosettiformis TaxID=378272 RepID=A0ACB8U502_9APHY|nr:hypothetical protein BDY19DRAFT_905735 [Irpex rosettiformis]